MSINNRDFTVKCLIDDDIDVETENNINFKLQKKCKNISEIFGYIKVNNNKCSLYYYYEENLANLISNNKKLYIDVYNSLLNIVKYFHEFNFVIRNLNPKNIFLYNNKIIFSNFKAVIQYKYNSGNYFYLKNILYSPVESYKKNYIVTKDMLQNFDLFSVGLILYEIIFKQSFFKKKYDDKLKTDILNKKIFINLKNNNQLIYPKSWNNNFIITSDFLNSKSDNGYGSKYLNLLKRNFKHIDIYKNLEKYKLEEFNNIILKHVNMDYN